MPEANRHDLELPGCTPEPLMAYLKALGILRLVSGQNDPDARGWWKNDLFWLRSPELFGRADTDDAKRDALVKFFLEEYKPTPIVVPWTGTDFFAVNTNGEHRAFSKTPTGSAAIEALLRTTSNRLAPYREGIRLCLDCLRELDFTSKKVFEGSQKDKNKSRYIQLLRSVAPDAVVDWIDVTTVIGHGKVEFSAMLGSGGGSDGNTHFSDNFMQNLWEMLPDFDSQREQQKKKPTLTSNVSEDLLRSALFSSATQRLVEKRTSALYDSGAVGGANATQGLRRGSLSNPWNVILLFEGTLSIAGAMSKRSDPDRLSASVSRPDRPAFPFQFDFTPSLDDRSAPKESTAREIWFPVWPRPATHNEIANLFGEGRGEVSRRPARNGTEMAQAAATLGVDRGISRFRRYAIVKGRVGGENYNTAASLGVFDVREQENAQLLARVNKWLDRFRRAAGDKNAPPRFGSALRRIDSAIFDFCKYGGKSLFQRVVVALGRAERELANAERFRETKKLRPLAGLSSSCLVAADDGSSEFAVARSLASIHDSESKIGPLRINLEPVDWQKRCRAWAERERCVVWNSADLATNMAHVLARRMMDGARAGCERLPLASRFTVALDHVAAFIAGALDDERIEQLIWGLMLINGWHGRPARECNDWSSDRTAPATRPLPRPYALLKLLFMPRPLAVHRRNGKLHWQLAKNGESGIVIRPEPRILPLLRSGRIGEACRIAAQRLRVSGLSPIPGPLPTGVIRDNEWSELTMDPRSAQRLPAALLIPVSPKSVNRLVHLVCRADDSAAAEFAVSAEGESE